MGLDMDEAARTLPEATAVLTVHGDEDRVIPVRDARDFDARICNHKLRVVPGASHNFDRPGNRDAIKTAAADFLCPS